MLIVIMMDTTVDAKPNNQLARVSPTTFVFRFKIYNLVNSYTFLNYADAMREMFHYVKGS